MTISLCVIACNEEDNILHCLESARGLADEIIVADTGSTDRTKSVCEEYDARVYDYKWAEDFSAARNYNFS